jgi:hypothetical protein
MYTLFFNVALWNKDLRTKMIYFQTKERLVEFLNEQKTKYVVSDVVAYDPNNSKMEIT